MSKIDKLKINALIHKIGLKYNLTDSVIKDIVDSPYIFTVETIKELNLDNIKTEEELSVIKSNFLYRAFGRIYVSFPLINRRNNLKSKSINLNKWKK